MSVKHDEPFILKSSVGNISQLNFPYGSAPARATTIEVGHGVNWLSMPMPYQLDHVNVYLLRGDTGSVIVDTGLNNPEVKEIWNELFKSGLTDTRVAAVLCTHFHTDHSGLAGYFAEQWRVPLLMSQGEYFTQRGWPLLNDIPWQHKKFFQECGCPEKLYDKNIIMFNTMFNSSKDSLPPTFLKISEGDRIPYAADCWQAIVGSGHSPEHVLLYSSEHGILISGDQLLPNISTNVSVYAVDPADEPLSRWFATLNRLEELPDNVLVLPSHGLPFYGIRTRIAELREIHERIFTKVLNFCGKSKSTAFELAERLYPFKFTGLNFMLALGETLAHVRYLTAYGYLEEKPDISGVMRYQTLKSQSHRKVITGMGC